MNYVFIEPSILPSQDPVMLHIEIEGRICEAEEANRPDPVWGGGISSLFYAKEGRVEYFINRKVQGPRSKV